MKARHRPIIRVIRMFSFFIYHLVLGSGGRTKKHVVLVVLDLQLVRGSLVLINVLLFFLLFFGTSFQDVTCETVSRFYLQVIQPQTRTTHPVVFHFLQSLG